MILTNEKVACLGFNKQETGTSPPNSTNQINSFHFSSTWDTEINPQKKKKKDHEKYMLMHYAYTSQNDRGDHFEALNSISIT